MYNNEYETDDSSYSSTEDDDEMDIYDITYEPEEPSLTKYNIVLCVKYNKLIHGDVDGEINNHYLTLIRFKFSLMKFDEINFDYIINTLGYNRNDVRLEITECIYLPSEYCISIIKTHWLRLIQRTWKRIYKERKNILMKRYNPRSLKYREIYGKWPNDCIYLPQLKGMLLR